MTLKSGTKFEEKLTCHSENDMMNFANFHQSTRKCHNWNFNGILFVQRRKCMSIKLTEELFVMAMKNDTKIEQELICHF